MVFCLWVQDVLDCGNSVCGCGYTVTHPQHNIVPPCLVQSHDITTSVCGPVIP